MMIHATKTLLLCTPVIISLMLYRNFLENTGRQIMCSEYKKTTQNTKWNDLIAQRKARILKRKWLSQKGNEQCFYLWWVAKRQLHEMRMDFCFFVLCFNNTIPMARCIRCLWTLHRYPSHFCYLSRAMRSMYLSYLLNRCASHHAYDENNLANRKSPDHLDQVIH